MKESMKKTRPVRWGLLLAALMLGVLQASAVHVTDTYSYKTKLTVDQTGMGTVYMNYNALNQDNSGKTTTSTRNYTATVREASTTTSITLNATPNEGYRFLSWTNDLTGATVSSTSSSPTTQLSYNTTGAQRTEDDALWGILWWYNYEEQNFAFTAHFKENGNVIAKVKDGQEAVGSAVIVQEHFAGGDIIQLVASTINSSEMIGWSFDHWELNGATFPDNENHEITVTVPNDGTTDTYVAVFVKADTENYCFLKNKATGRYLKLVGKNDYTASVNQNSGEVTASINNSFAMRDAVAAISDPGCVFLVSGVQNGNALKNGSLSSQNTVVGNVGGSVVIKKALNIRPMNDGTYSISFVHTAKVKGQNVDFDLYFSDKNGTAGLSTANDANTEWEIQILNKSNINKWYFGAAPNSTIQREGKYYTTLYTTFPYELQSGKAYYINHESIMKFGEDEDHFYKVKCFEVEDGIVPAMTPVIIECDGDNAADNKLLPLPSSTSITAIDGSLMNGQISLLTGPKVSDGNIYVLSKVDNGGVGFYRLKAGITIPDNKAYANLSEEAANEAKRVSYVFGEEEEYSEATNINKQVSLPEDLMNCDIYDLQGRRVNNPQHGVYIVNGKKFIIR